MKLKRLKPLVLTAIIVYTAIMIYFMFFGFGRITYAQHLYNLVPFKSIREAFEHYMFYTRFPAFAGVESWHFAVNVFGNIGVFVPFGNLLTILFDFRFAKPLAVFETGLLTSETAQLISRRGVFDVDDILLNTVGFLIGYAIIMAIYKIINKQNQRKVEESEKI
ncbi:MAG: VanZ family protein [Oscillospiraceae bacterium]|nr:VanZ family protein [Oscillospiraceae bacterium]